MLDRLIEKYAGFGMSVIEATIIFIVGWYAVKIILHILSKMMRRSQIDAIIENFVISILNIGLKIIVIIYSFTSNLNLKKYNILSIKSWNINC